MTIELIKISSVDLPHHPSYVALNMEHTSKMCEMLKTDSTVWSDAQIDRLDARAIKGEFDMHIFGNRTTITLP